MSRRIDLTDLLQTIDPRVRAEADALVDQAGREVFTDLGYTEKRVEWVLLRMHASRGQIRPAVLTRMRTEDLEYLAGLAQLDSATPRTTGDWAAEVKVVENAVRAERVLRHRSTFRTTIWATSVATVLGSVVAGFILQVG